MKPNPFSCCRKKRTVSHSFLQKQLLICTSLVLAAGLSLPQVKAEDLVLGFNAGSNETEEFSVGTRIFDLVELGVYGTGTLTLSGEEGATLAFMAPSVVLGVASSGVGTLNLNSQSVLLTGEIRKGLGQAFLNFDGGILYATQDNENYLSNFASGDVNLASKGVSFYTDGRHIGVSSALAGVGGLTKLAEGTLTLSGSSSYSGGTTVVGGTLVVGGSGAAISHATADMIVGRDTGSGSNGTLKIDAGAVVSNRDGILGADLNTIGTATVSGTWANAGVLSVGDLGSGTVHIENGGLVSASSVSIGNSASGVGALNLNNGGTLATGGLIKGDGVASLKIDGGTLRATRDNAAYLSGFGEGDIILASGGAAFDTNGYSVGIAASFSGEGAFVKSGSGTLTLSGSHNYTGETHLMEGSLKVNGGLNGGGAVMVESGASLSGSGKIAGSVTIKGGGAFFAGGGSGALTLGSLSLNSASISDFALAGSGSLASVTGDLSLGGTLNLSSVTANGTYTLFTYGGQLGSSRYSLLGVVPEEWNMAQFDIDLSTAGEVRLVVDNTVKGQYWGGTSDVPSGAIGGNGVWRSAGTNWTNHSGSLNRSWQGAIALFSGSAGTVSVADAITFKEMQFQTGGYEIEAGGGSLLATGTAELFAAANVSAKISAGIGQSGTAAIVKTGSGTLILSGSNNYQGGTIVRSGTLLIEKHISHNTALTVVGEMDGDEGTLKIGEGGYLNDKGASLGSTSKASGTAIVSGSWRTVALSSWYVGRSGTGILNIEQTGSVHVNGSPFYLGYESGSAGFVTVDGRLDLNGGIDVGFSGNGSLTIGQTGYVRNSGGSLGSGTNSSGIATVSGTWNAGYLYVGYRGTGTLNIEQGGIVSNTLASAIGLSAGSKGVANVSGTWTNPDRILVGSNGNGTLNIENKGVVIASAISVGQNANGSGTMNLNSGGLLMTGTLSKGTGSATVNFNGGTLRAAQDNESYFRNFAYGDVTLAAGGVIFDSNGYSIGVSTALSGTAGLTKSGAGLLTLGGSNSYKGGTTVSGGTLAVNGSISNNAAMVVGNVNGTNGTLVINSGATVYSGTSTLGVTSNSVGTAIVRGRWENSGYLALGERGIGVLNIEDGGYVSNSAGFLGYGIGSQASATVSGTWHNTSTLYVGFVSSGTLNIQSGGNVSSTDGVLGYQQVLGLPRGIVNVSGTWLNTGSLYVGASGTAALNIESGGVVSSQSVYVASSYAGSVVGSGGSVNLKEGGTLITSSIGRGIGIANVNLDGGAIRATQDNAYFFQNFENINGGKITLGLRGGTFDTNGYNIGVSISLFGTGRLTKIGSGTLAFSGSNAHAGEVSVDGGVLKADGVLDSTRITVNGGGTLGGSGTVKEVTLNQYGLISPGNSAGTLHTGSQIWNEGAGYLWEVGSLTDSAQRDLLEISGTLTLNPGDAGISILISSLSLDNDSSLPFSFVPNSTYRFTIATTTGGIIGFDANAFIIDTDAFNSTLGNFGVFSVGMSDNGRNLELNYTVIPEPGTWSLLIGGGFFAIAILRRKRFVAARH